MKVGRYWVWWRAETPLSFMTDGSGKDVEGFLDSRGWMPLPPGGTITAIGFGTRG